MDPITFYGPHEQDAVLCVGNQRALTGYAWTGINGLYGAVCDEASARGLRPIVCYYRVDGHPAGVSDSTRIVELDARMQSWRSVLATLGFCRRERVRIVYLTDRASCSILYTLLRLAGVRRIVVHHRLAGGGTTPTGIKRWIKLARRWLPGASADVEIAVSDYVVRTRERVSLTSGIKRAWNHIEPPTLDRATASRMLRDEFDIAEDRLIIGCSARAHPGKGVEHLLSAFNCIAASRYSTRPVLVYFGDGPLMDSFRARVKRMRHPYTVILAGYRDDAPLLLGGCDIVVVPSTIDEAFGRAALEAMSWGVPVIASDIGGLPEVVGSAGVLVPPGDEIALARALDHLLSDELSRDWRGRVGMGRTRQLFSRDDAVAAVSEMVLG
jgi:glycosyltransferase involved in cell wall biosynthesis